MAEKVLEKKNSVTILWQIGNLSQWKTHPTTITSPLFTTRNLNNVKMFLLLYPKGKNDDDKHVRLVLGTCDKTLNYPIDYEWSFLGSDKLPICSTTQRDQTIQQGTLVASSFCPLQEQVFVTHKSLFLPNDTLTVRCRIWKSTGEHVPVERFSLRSQIVVEENSFEWPVFTRSLSLGSPISYTASELFKDESGKINLQFFLTGPSIEKSVVMFETSVPARQNDLFVKLTVSFRDSFEVVNKTHTFHPSDTRWNASTYCKRKTLISYSDSGRVELFCTLVCTFCSNSITKHDFEFQSEVSEETNNINNLKGDFLFLYQEQTFSDFELRCSDVSFHVHKNILSARSPFFRAMFSRNMEESASNSLDVPDLDTHTLNRFLTFLYTGTIEQLQWEEAAKLYFAADKYDASFLKQLCASTLQSSIETSNLCDILVMAEKHKDQHLTSNVHDFILSDFDEIMNSKEWKSFMEKHPVLSAKIMHHLCKKMYQLSKQQNGCFSKID